MEITSRASLREKPLCAPLSVPTHSRVGRNSCQTCRTWLRDVAREEKCATDERGDALTKSSLKPRERARRWWGPLKSATRLRSPRSANVKRELTLWAGLGVTYPTVCDEGGKANRTHTYRGQCSHSMSSRMCAWRLIHGHSMYT